MNYLVVAASVALFLLFFKILRVASVAQAAIAEAGQAAKILRDPSIDEDQKETRLQKASIYLFRKLFSIVVLAAVCIAVSMAPIALASWAGIATEEEVIPLFTSWEVIIVTTIVFVIAWRWS